MPEGGGQLAEYGAQAKSGSLPGLVTFYWIVAPPTHLHTACSYVHAATATMAELSSWNRGCTWRTDPELFSVWLTRGLRPVMGWVSSCPGKIGLT